jgi:hypothetical protein
MEPKNIANKELINQARGANLAEYFRSSGFKTERHGKELYVKDFPGLCVNEQTNSWYSHYEGVGGHNAIDCLTKVCNVDFKTAVSQLSGNDLQQAKSVPKIEEKTEKNLTMPDRAEDMRRTFAYFVKSRKIPAEIVSEFALKGLLYQSQGEVTANVKGVQQTFKVNNAVFVHTEKIGGEIDDKDAKIVGGEVQGINTYKRYKGVAEGTQESVFSFQPNPRKDGEIKKAYLFESAIDLMSFYSFCNDKKKLEGAVLVSMAGLKPAIPLKLQAEGVEILSCVDNDEKGKKFEQDNGFKRAGNMLEREGVKDWNDLLIKRSDGFVNVKSNAIELEKKSVLNFGARKTG